MRPHGFAPWICVGMLCAPRRGLPRACLVVLLAYSASASIYQGGAAAEGPRPRIVLHAARETERDDIPRNDLRLLGRGLDIEKMLYGWRNYATGLSVVTNDLSSGGLAGIDGGFQDPSRRGAYGNADQVGIYTQISAAPPLIVAATVDAGHIYFTRPLTPSQVGVLRPKMQVHTNQWPYWISIITGVSTDGRSATIDRWVRQGDAANITLGSNPAFAPYVDRAGALVQPKVTINPVNGLFGQNTLVTAIPYNYSDPSRAIGYELGCVNELQTFLRDVNPEYNAGSCWGFESQATVGKGSVAFLTQGRWDTGFAAFSGELTGFLASPNVLRTTAPTQAFLSYLDVAAPLLTASPLVATPAGDTFPYGTTVEVRSDGLLRLGAQGSKPTLPRIELYSAGGPAPAATITAKNGTVALPLSGDLTLASKTVAVDAMLVLRPFTPTSARSPCPRGATADDADYHYVCVEDDHWRRVRLSDF